MYCEPIVYEEEELMDSIRKESARYQAGDRVRVDKDVTTTSALPGYVGIVQEVILCYADKTIGYNVCLDGDPRPRRTWFFLQQQLTALARRRS
jgi:hypothetical protein